MSGSSSMIRMRFMRDSWGGQWEECTGGGGDWERRRRKKAGAAIGKSQNRWRIWLTGCRGPSTTRPARQTAGRRKKPAAPVGMTDEEKANPRAQPGIIPQTTRDGAAVTVPQERGGGERIL